MAASDGNFVQLCIIGLFVIAEAAIFSCVGLLIVGVVKLVKRRRKND